MDFSKKGKDYITLKFYPENIIPRKEIFGFEHRYGVTITIVSDTEGANRRKLTTRRTSGKTRAA